MFDGRQEVCFGLFVSIDKQPERYGNLRNIGTSTRVKEGPAQLEKT
jgi:hypothetical protein